MWRSSRPFATAISTRSASPDSTPLLRLNPSEPPWYVTRSRYEGEWRNGWQHGRGTTTWADGGRHEGEYRDGKRHGHGTRTWTDGRRYEGQWQDGKPHGEGTYTSDGYTRKGRWNKGCFGERGDGNWAAISTTAEACGFLDCTDLDARDRRLKREGEDLLKESKRVIVAKQGRTDFEPLDWFEIYELATILDRRLSDRWDDFLRRNDNFLTDHEHCKK